MGKTSALQLKTAAISSTLHKLGVALGLPEDANAAPFVTQRLDISPVPSMDSTAIFGEKQDLLRAYADRARSLAPLLAAMGCGWSRGQSLSSRAISVGHHLKQAF